VNEVNSILLSVKKVLGLGGDNADFDTDVLIHLNSVLSIVQQLGVGPEDGYYVTSEDQTWEDYLGEGNPHINMIKSYICAKVRLLFDPPVSSAVMESLNRTCTEFEWRANVAAENKMLHKQLASEGY